MHDNSPKILAAVEGDHFVIFLIKLIFFWTIICIKMLERNFKLQVYEIRDRGKPEGIFKKTKRIKYLSVYIYI